MQLAVCAGSTWVSVSNITHLPTADFFKKAVTASAWKEHVDILPDAVMIDWSSFQHVRQACHYRNVYSNKIIMDRCFVNILIYHMRCCCCSFGTLIVSLTVSTTIPLHQDLLGVDVAGLQGMQWVGTLQHCALWSGGSLHRGKQVMWSHPIGGEIRRIWPGHISDDSVWRTGVSVDWILVAIHSM